MTAKEVRGKYINFFKISPRNHIEIPPAPLVLENDPTTLFTSSGMQPLIPYLMGEPHPQGKRLVNSQPSIRTVDIEEVGDFGHLTFFEMLGNWSLGDYFKKEQIPWIFEFFTKELSMDKNKLWVSVFEGNKQVPKDKESSEIWKSLGIPEDKICFYDVGKNWWSRSGTPQGMPIGEIGGPDSEVFYDFGEELRIHENSQFKNQKCHPNCSCGRFLEIGNCVFIQYKKVGENKLEELPQKNVDFGGGLERITAAVNNEQDIFKIDLLFPIINQLEDQLGVKYNSNPEICRSLRIVADHLKASVFLIADGLRPDNKLQGYILRRLLRRSASKVFLINKSFDSKDFKSLVRTVINIYQDYFEADNYKEIEDIVSQEVRRFRWTIERGFKEIGKQQTINGKIAFDLYQSYGFPLELTEEIAGERGQEVDKSIFKAEFEKHKELSRTASAGVFKGGLADHSPEVIKLHTATHLLLASLRKVLGEHVVQKGQNITKERSRFDFPNPDKLTDEQIKKVEDLINDVIKKDLPVSFSIMPKDDAIKTGAIHAFNEKYADMVKVYYIGDSLEDGFSKEFCGGPHVTHTGEIGRVKIKKQEKIGSGLIRIYITID
jgi:alanyl-tRNA synthetase